MSLAPGNPLTGIRQEGTTWYSGIYIAEDIAMLAEGIESGSWLETGLGALATGLDTYMMVTDPLGSLTSSGIAWLIEHIRPLREALNRLAGDPAQIHAYAETWKAVAAKVVEGRTMLDEAVFDQLSDWWGPAADAYRGHATAYDKSMHAAANGALTLGKAVEVAGVVVGMVRMIVRNLIADFVATVTVRLAEWIALELCTVGLATPYVIAELSALVADWSAKIAGFITKLINSLKRLGNLVHELERLIVSIEEVLARLGHMHMEPVPAGGPSIHMMAGRGERAGGRGSGGGGRGSRTPARTRNGVNTKGEPYPQLIDPRTGQPIHYPGDGVRVVPKSRRVEWGETQRNAFRREWERRYGVPEGGWGQYQIHHIQPRQFGGSNAFENLVPLRHSDHVQYSRWWTNFE